MATCPLPRQTAASLLSSLEKTRQAICANPSAEIPSDIKKLRQANFKQEYKARHHGKRKAAACVGSPTAAGQQRGAPMDRRTMTMRVMGEPMTGARRNLVS